MHLASRPRADIPPPSFEMRYQLWWHRATKLQRFFCYIRCQPSTHRGRKRWNKLHTPCEHNFLNNKKTRNISRWRYFCLFFIIHKLFFCFLSLSHTHSCLILSFLLITVQLPMVSISTDTATQQAAPIMSYTSLPLWKNGRSHLEHDIPLFWDVQGSGLCVYSTREKEAGGTVYCVSGVLEEASGSWKS